MRRGGRILVSIAAGAVAVGGSLLGFVGPADGSGAWSFMSSPNPRGSYASLNSVVCLTPDNCEAVGNYNAEPLGEVAHGLVERWDGHRWSVVPTPGVKIFARLSGVSCTTPSFCMAVGWRTGQTLTERWNGVSWSIVPSANRPRWSDNLLDDVSCRTSKDCFAVGTYFGGYGQYTEIQHWDGRHWSMVPSPNVPPVANPGNGLLGISCTTGSACIAVGTTGTAAGALAEQWDGSRWNVMPTAAGSRPGDVLRAVKCTSNTNCFAVGSTKAGQSLVERWNGTTWTIMPSPNRSANNALLAVKCVTVADCVAVGGQSLNAPSIGSRLIEHWNGAAWSIVPSAGPAPTAQSYLAGVSCTSAGNCIAVGRFDPNYRTQKTLVERYAP
jgi:hypothetical protein